VSNFCKIVVQLKNIIIRFSIGVYLRFFKNNFFISSQCDSRTCQQVRWSNTTRRANPLSFCEISTWRKRKKSTKLQKKRIFPVHNWSVRQRAVTRYDLISCVNCSLVNCQSHSFSELVAVSVCRYQRSHPLFLSVGHPVWWWRWWPLDTATGSLIVIVSNECPSFPYFTRRSARTANQII